MQTTPCCTKVPTSQTPSENSGRSPDRQQCVAPLSRSTYPGVLQEDPFLETDLYFQRRQLEFALQPDHFQELEHHCTSNRDRESLKSKSTQIRKFDTLLAHSQGRCKQSPPSQWVRNLSSKPLTQPQQSVLAKGLNFAVTPKYIPVPRIVASVEDALKRAHLPEDASDRAHSQVIGALSKARTTTPNLLPSESKAIRELRNDTSLMILPADKGRTTVVMDKTTYDTKVANMLTDASTYKPLQKDPTPALQRKMNSLLLTLHKSGHLSDQQYHKLRDSAGRIPQLYALPKIHKPDVPLRPIVSFVSSPTYSLSKHLVSILSPLVGNPEHHVQNSTDFAKFISAQTIEDNEVLVSFDVVSLFTRIPTSLAIQVARQRLHDDTSLPERTSLTPKEIVSLLELCLNATYFTFRSTYYQQVHGTAMGSPVSVVAAELVMEDVESRALSTYPHPPKFWKRYVDDTCCALDAQHVDDFHQHINTIEDTIQFTVERESKSQLAFLDVLITRNPDRTLATNVYRKPTHTDRYLDFQSHHPVSHKIAVVRTLNHRAKNLSSTPVAIAEEERKVAQALKKNGYPQKIIEQQPRPCPPSQNTTESNTYMTIPYIRNTSEAIRRILTPLGIRTSFQPINTLRQVLVHPKDPVAQEDRAGVVYQIPCSRCSQTYIGQTGRTLGKRLKEHQRAVRDRNTSTSALAEHVCNTGHPVEWSQTQVIESCRHTSKRCLLESWMIQRQRPSTLNREPGPLPTAYRQLF